MDWRRFPMSMTPPPNSNGFNNFPPYATNPLMNPYAARRGPYDDPFRAIQEWNNTPNPYNSQTVLQKELPQCGKCLQAVRPQDRHNYDKDQYYHADCFVCDICKVPLWNTSNYTNINRKLFCYIHTPSSTSEVTMHKAYGMDRMSTSEVPDISEAHLAINVQPAVYQIANYNVHPPPKLLLMKAIPAEHVVTANLVEVNSGYEMSDGFQTTITRTLKPGGNCLIFTGLKLNKMGKIKNELRQHHIMRFDKFLIRFRLGKQTWDSQHFKLVSSCTQLPPELKEVVRPSKKFHGMKRMSMDSTSDIAEPDQKRTASEDASEESKLMDAPESPEQESPSGSYDSYPLPLVTKM